MNTGPYHLRPHHGMCVCFFQGKGYSSEFTAHMAHIIEQLRADPKILLTNSTDILCSKCPNNLDGICETAEKVARYDAAVLELCGLEDGALLPFRDFQAKVWEHILRPGKRAQICGDCQWSRLCHLK